MNTFAFILLNNQDMRLRLLLLGIIIGNFAFSQNAENQPIKSSYIVVNASSEEETDKILRAAMNYADFDQFRFLDSRRQIPIKNSSAFLELYSANELESNYGKPVSPHTIMPNQTYLNISFDFVDSKEPLFYIVYSPE